MLFEYVASSLIIILALVVLLLLALRQYDRDTIKRLHCELDYQHKYIKEILQEKSDITWKYVDLQEAHTDLLSKEKPKRRMNADKDKA